MTRRLFVPKPFSHGDHVTWTHETSSGARVERAGVVVCDAPTVNGAACRWVVPDQPQPGDTYSAVPVVRANRAGFSLARSVWSGGSTWAKGQMASSDRAGTVTADFMVSAWQHGETVRKQNTTREAA